MAIDPDRIVQLKEKWQAHLRLRDWDIQVRPVETPWRKTGDIKIDADDRKAILMVNTVDPKYENLEEVVIHELLHLKLWAMDSMLEELLTGLFGEDAEDPKHRVAYGQYMTLLESTVEDLTKSFLSLGGEDRQLSFGRVNRMVEQELSGT